MANPKHTSNPEKFYVYFLIDPRNEKVFYVGQTRDWNERYKAHVRRSTIEADLKKEEGGSWTKDKYILEILDQGMLPAIYIREEVYSREDALMRERAWMIYFTQQGITLVNQVFWAIDGLGNDEHPSDNYASINRIRIDQRHNRPLGRMKEGSHRISQKEMLDIILNPSRLSVRELADKHERPIRMIQKILENHNQKKRRKN